MWSRTAALAAVLALAACRAQPSEPRFPSAQRDVAPQRRTNTGELLPGAGQEVINLLEAERLHEHCSP